MYLTIEKNDGTRIIHEIDNFGVTKRFIWYDIVGSHTVQMNLKDGTYRINDERPES
jgi:hypothetical protein